MRNQRPDRPPRSLPKAGALFVLLLSISFSTFSQHRFLDSLLRSGLPAYQAVLNSPGKYKLQVIYTQINRDSNNHASFTNYSFHVNSNYVYPASTVKLPISILALQKLEELNRPGLDADSPMMTDSAFYCQKKVRRDSAAASGYPSIGRYIKKMLLVSDNAAFARTYEFVGYDYAHGQLAKMGFNNIRLLNRLDGQCPGDTGRVMPPVLFLNARGDTVYKQPLSLPAEKREHPVRNSQIGRSHMNMGRLVKGPKDFSGHNYLPPAELHELMKALVFNNDAPRLPLSNAGRQFLLKQLGSYPRESDSPVYDKKIFYDSFKKYLYYGAATASISQDTLRVINIVGRAYGFLIDCAYVADLKNNIEFLLTSCIYVNAGGNAGSGKYEYDRLGLPFMKDLGRCIYGYEQGRKRGHVPDLQEFRTLFEKK